MDGLIEGRMVHYVISDMDAEAINRRRSDYMHNAKVEWPAGAQAHVGNHVMAGEHLPAVVVRVWSGEFGDEPGVNLQVFLDGNDQYWATSVRFAPPEEMKLGTCHWIERA